MKNGTSSLAQYQLLLVPRPTASSQPARSKNSPALRTSGVTRRPIAGATTQDVPALEGIHRSPGLRAPCASAPLDAVWAERFRASRHTSVTSWGEGRSRIEREGVRTVTILEPAPRVDLHTHVLPGLDDGARDLAESLAMLRVAAEDGTGILVATPHARRCTAAAARSAAELVREHLLRAEIPVTLLLGMEEQLLPDLPDRLLAGEALPIGETRWLLVELPDWTVWPEDLADQLAALRALDYRPILAHVERYVPVQQEPARILEAIAAGARIQVNADSLFGRNGYAAQRVAAQLLRAGVVSVLASDAHKADWRAPRLHAAFQRVRDLAGDEVATRLHRNAHAVVRGEDIPVPEPDLATLEASPTFLERLRSWVGV